MAGQQWHNLRDGRKRTANGRAAVPRPRVYDHHIRGRTTSGQTSYSVMSTAKPFEPIAEVDQTLSEFEEYMLKARAAIDRLHWLKDKIAADFDALERDRDSVEIYTEEQAAAIMQIKPSQLAALRRRHKFEHINFGSFIRYNREQIIAICETLTIGDKQKGISMAPKTMLRAA